MRHGITRLGIVLLVACASAAATAQARPEAHADQTPAAGPRYTSGELRALIAYSNASFAEKQAILRGAATFTVSSTLSQTRVLPHRIHWLGKPSLPPSRIREVDFLIDGRRSWVEHYTPYSYGYDGNYLVTSWMRPGLHTFTVVAVATDGRRTTASSTARTLPPPAPPAALARSWSRKVSAAEAGPTGAPGVWTLVVSPVGWRILDPSGRRGALVDVAYISPQTVEARGGVATRNHDPRENNPWCDEPFQPVRYRWHVSGNRLTLTLAGPRRCDGQSGVLAGDWTRGSTEPTVRGRAA